MNLTNLPGIRAVTHKFNTWKRIKEGLDWHRSERDVEEEQRSKLPDNEDIRIRSVWLAEAFPPSMISKLVDALTNQGWNTTDQNLSSDRHLGDWIKSTRSNGTLGSWVNGGTILRPGDSRFMGSNVRRSKLPDAVDYASLSIRNVTSSLTIVTIQLILKEQPSKRLNDVMKATYRTKLDLKPSLWNLKTASYVGVVTQKKQAVQDDLADLHKPLYAWIKSVFPGYFSSQNNGSVYPTIDFLTSQKYKYPKSDDKYVRDDYMDVLFGNSSEIWNCKQFKGLELRVPSTGRSDLGVTLFGNFDKLDKSSKGYGTRLTGKLEDYFNENMSLWSAHVLMLNYERSLSRFRDEAASDKRSIRKVVKSLSSIRHEFMAVSGDSQIVGRDLAVRLGKESSLYRFDAIDFSPPSFRKDYPDYFEMIRQQDVMRIERLEILGSLVRDAVISGGNLASAIANLRIQRFVFWLAVIAAVLTAISVREPIWNALNATYDFVVCHLQPLLQSKETGY